MPMTLVSIVVVLVVIGLVMWLINTYIPMAAGIKSLLNIVVFIVVVVWLLQGFGLIGNIPGVHMPPLR
ncbi:MAG: Thivi_2564 family membrane protein [Candidatus Binataceae bacterium]